MSEVTFDVKCIGVKWKCHKCDGEMIYDNKGILLSSPPQFGHVCDKCGTTINLLDKYPTVRYIRE